MVRYEHFAQLVQLISLSLLFGLLSSTRNVCAQGPPEHEENSDILNEVVIEEGETYEAREGTIVKVRNLTAHAGSKITGTGVIAIYGQAILNEQVLFDKAQVVFESSSHLQVSGKVSISHGTLNCHSAVTIDILPSSELQLNNSKAAWHSVLWQSGVVKLANMSEFGLKSLKLPTDIDLIVEGEDNTLLLEDVDMTDSNIGCSSSTLMIVGTVVGLHEAANCNIGSTSGGVIQINKGQTFILSGTSLVTGVSLIVNDGGTLVVDGQFTLDTVMMTCFGGTVKTLEGEQQAVTTPTMERGRLTFITGRLTFLQQCEMKNIELTMQQDSLAGGLDVELTNTRWTLRTNSELLVQRLLLGDGENQIFIEPDSSMVLGEPGATISSDTQDDLVTVDGVLDVRVDIGGGFNAPLKTSPSTKVILPQNTHFMITQPATLQGEWEIQTLVIATPPTAEGNPQVTLGEDFNLVRHSGGLPTLEITKDAAVACLGAELSAYIDVQGELPVFGEFWVPNGVCKITDTIVVSGKVILAPGARLDTTKGYVNVRTSGFLEFRVSDGSVPVHGTINGCRIDKQHGSGYTLQLLEDTFRGTISSFTALIDLGAASGCFLGGVVWENQSWQVATLGEVPFVSIPEEGIFTEAFALAQVAPSAPPTPSIGPTAPPSTPPTDPNRAVPTSPMVAATNEEDEEEAVGLIHLYWIVPFSAVLICVCIALLLYIALRDHVAQSVDEFGDQPPSYWMPEGGGAYPPPTSPMQLPTSRLESPRREVDLSDIVPYYCLDTHSSNGTPRGTPRLAGHPQGIMTGPVAHLTPMPPMGDPWRSGTVTPQSPHGPRSPRRFTNIKPIDTISVSSYSAGSNSSNAHGRMSPLANIIVTHANEQRAMQNAIQGYRPTPLGQLTHNHINLPHPDVADSVAAQRATTNNFQSTITGTPTQNVAANPLANTFGVSPITTPMGQHDKSVNLNGSLNLY